jgi:predicted aldo/keto reductase-like oxidoreductase
MQYRTFNKIDIKTSLLGMGAMRFPLNEDGSVNESEAIKIVRTAIDSGINYVDTAYGYHGGASEVIVGKALQDGYREKIILADKMPAWLAKDEEEMKQIFYTQLERLGVDYIDMYLVHNVNRGIWKRCQKFNVMDFLTEMKAQGKIKHIGFSFHDSLDFFEEMLDAYPWEFCQIQLNYMDINHQAGVKGLKLAAEKGLGVIIMEPLKGGRLTDKIPPAIQEIWNEAEIKRSPAEWAFKWLAAKPEVTLMLSGMSSMEQLEANLEIFAKEDVAILTEQESALVEKVSDKYNQLIPYSCTGCEYCLPCPQKLDIPKILSYFNDWNVYEQNPSTKNEYSTWLVKHASDCIGCGACEENCPQSLPIAEAMKAASEAFGK